MSIDTILAALGILVTVVVAIVGANYVIKKRVMKQSATNKSSAIQSGRDTKING